MPLPSVPRGGEKPSRPSENSPQSRPGGLPIPRALPTAPKSNTESAPVTEPVPAPVVEPRPTPAPQPAPEPVREAPVAPEPMVEDDDAFEQIEESDLSDFYDDDDDYTPKVPSSVSADLSKPEREVEAEPEPVATESDDDDEVEEAPKKSRRGGSSAKRSKKSMKVNLKKDVTEDTFIDEENLKLKPFGRKTRKAKVNEFDNRTNLRRKAMIVQFTVIGLLIALVGLGLKNALVPPKSLSEDDVATIVNTSMGDTGFPVERGEGFVKNFMSAYLNIDGGTGVSNRVLAYYYNGSFEGELGDITRTSESTYRQKVLYGPEVYKSEGLTENSASYVVGAIVQPESTEAKAPSDGSAADWAFFNVNVYYDKEKDNFLVTPESPTVVPAEDVADATTMPAPEDIGTGESDDELNEEVKSVVNGFVKGYAISSTADHSALDQYVTDSNDPSLTRGLNKRYTLDGEVENAVTYTAYETDDPNVVKAEVKVLWGNSLGELVKASYTSTYIMTLEKQANGKYLVSKFAPRYYVASDSVE